METKDYLQEILGEIDQINETIDLEKNILQSILRQQELEVKISRYKTNGIRGLAFSLVLIFALGVICSYPKEVQIPEISSIKYISILTSLVVLFIQLETGGFKFIINLKNKLS